MRGKQLCNRLMNQPWTGVHMCGAVKRGARPPYYHIGTTKSATMVQRLVPTTVLTRWRGEVMRLPVVVKKEPMAMAYASLGQQQQPLPKSLLVPAVIGVGISLATMAAVTFGLAYAVNKEEEHWRGEE